MTLRGAAWTLAYIGLISLPLLVLLSGDRAPGRSFWWDLSMGLGFAAIAMMGAQFALTARFRRASAPFGLDILYYFHRVLAIGALAFVLGHFGILYIRYQHALGELNPLHARWELTAGRVALVSFAALIISSEFRKRLRLEYGLWRYLHVGLAVLGFAAALAHILGVGYYTDTPVKRALWVSITAFWLGLLVWIRIGKPAAQKRRPWRLAENRAERGGARTLVFEPDGHAGLGGWRPGQFAWATIGASPYLLREHPFSISSAPETGPSVAMTIAPLGDFTKKIPEIPAGETVYLDGPYGRFSIDVFPDAPGFVFVAGGIGVTPLIANLRSMAARGDARPVTLFYANAKWDDVAFREDLDDLSNRLNLTVIHVIEEPPEEWSGEKGRIDKEILARHLPAAPETFEHLMCGPAPMTAAVRDALGELGVPPTRMHFELFELA